MKHHSADGVLSADSIGSGSRAEGIDASKAEEYVLNQDQEVFRRYRDDPRAGVKEFYRLNHTSQTLEFVLGKKKELLSLKKRKMGMWEAIQVLEKLVDDSDPDTELSQLEHLLQTAEAIRSDGHPRWFILTGLIHDLGKVLYLFGEPQWAVVGDTFPVGCRFSEAIVFHEYFKDNPDTLVPQYQSLNGIYEKNCGLDNVHMSWGHDEYLYQVVKDYLPDQAAYILRYHSFYAGHREMAYDHLMNDYDRSMFKWVKAFSPYDLYSKGDKMPNVSELGPFYQELLDEFFPTSLQW